MKNIKIKNLYFHTQYYSQKELPISRTNIIILVLALTFASISILINRPYMSLFAQLLEAGKGLLNSIEDYTQYEEEMQSNSLTWPFKKVVHRGKVTNYRDIRTKHWEQIPNNLKVPFPSDPLKYINKRREISPYSPPSSNKEDFLLYKRLFTTLWNGGYSCDLTECQRWDQTQGEHEGVDIVMPLNAPIQSISNGIVIEKNGNSSPYLGNYIVVLTKIDGQYYGIYYGHMNSIAPDIKEGSIIKKGKIIGYVGNTGKSFGSHLHLQINKLGSKKLSKTSLSKQLSKIWTDKNVTDPIKSYSVDPLVFIQKHIKNLKSTSEQLSNSINELQKAINDSPPTTNSTQEQKLTSSTTQPQNTNTSKHKKTEKLQNDQNQFSISYLPNEPVANSTISLTILGNNRTNLLLKVFTPEGELQKIKISSLPAKINISTKKAGYYLISLFNGNKKIAKEKIKVKPFKDINGGQNFTALTYLFNNNIVQGFEGNLNPSQLITRAQLISILMRAIYQGDIQQLKNNMANYIDKNGAFFNDVKGDEWFAPWAYMAYKLGYLKGESGNFLPHQSVSRAQMVAIYGRIFEKERFSQAKLRKDVNSSDRFYKYAVAAKYENLLVNKDKYFKPDENISRLEAFLTLYRYIKSQHKNLSFSLEEITTALAY